MAEPQTFGARLKALREERKLTQTELAEQAGMSKFGIAKLEQDQYSPSWPTVQALAKALGVSCTAFEGTVQPPEGSDKPPATKGRPRKQPVEEPPAEPQSVEPVKPAEEKRRPGRPRKPKDQG